MTWVYIKSEPQLWTVGFYEPKGRWHPDSDHGQQEHAAIRCAWLNGGTKAEPVEYAPVLDLMAALKEAIAKVEAV